MPASSARSSSPTSRAVAEPTPQDVRRLRTLEGRLEKVQVERKDLVAERRELRRRIAAEERRTREAEKRFAEAGPRLDELLEENRTLAARLDEVTSELEMLRTSALGLREQLDGARAELKEAGGALRATERDLAKVGKERDALADRLKAAEAQVKAKGMTPLVPAAEVARLVDRLISEIGSGLPGLAVRDGEVQLRVAVGRVGRVTGFVLPTAESPPELRESLHDLKLRFDRTLDPGQLGHES